MADRALLLGLPHWTTFERGFVLLDDFGLAGNGAGVDPAQISGEFELDPATGYACCETLLSLADALAWEELDTDWSDCAPFADDAGEPVGAALHTGSDPFSLTSTTTPDAGVFVGFLPYAGGSPFTLGVGSNFLVRVDGGLVTLSELDDAGETELASGRLWDVEQWTDQVHYLFVYQVGRRLIARQLGAAGNERVRSVVAWPTLDWTPAPVTVEGEGFLALAVAPERHATGLRVERAGVDLPEECTTEPAGSVESLTPEGVDAPELELQDANGVPLEDPPYTSLGYKVTATRPAIAGPNVYLTRVRAGWPALAGNDAQVGVDLLSLPGLAVTQVTEHRDLSVEAARVGFHLVAPRGTFSPYLLPNMRGSWQADGVARAEFWTSRPSLSRGTVLEEVSVEAELGWKRFVNTLWPGDQTFAGLTLADCYAQVALAAGMNEAMIDIAGGEFELPAQRADGQPLLDFKPGQRLSEMLTYLRDNFDAQALIRFAGDGSLVIEPRPTGASGVVFGAGDDGGPYLLRDTWRERFDETGFANEVIVIGKADDGAPLAAVATDWPSIRGHEDGSLPFNYVGEFRRLTIVDAGLTTQELVDLVCREAYTLSRLLRLQATARGPLVVNLLPGDIVTVTGLGDWRVTSINATWDRDWRAGLAEYGLEKFVGESS